MINHERASVYTDGFTAGQDSVTTDNVQKWELKKDIFILEKELRKYTDIPKHETIKQWQARTGQTYPDDAPAYWFHSGYEEWSDAVSFEDAKNESSFIIVANHHGKPKE